MKTIALIPARKNSKKVQRKNIRLLSKEPLINHTIKAALGARLVEAVVVSTDCSETAQIASRAGAWVPFVRPPNIARDNTPDPPVIRHAIEWIEKNSGKKLDAIAFLRPTTPFKTGVLIDECVQKLQDDGELSAVRTITPVEGVYHPYWCIKVQQGLLRPFIEGVQTEKYYQRQLLPACYRLNGVVDVVRRDRVMDCNDIYGDRTGFIEVEETAAVDIDNEFDFQFCEFLMNKCTAAEKQPA